MTKLTYNQRVALQKIEREGYSFRKYLEGAINQKTVDALRRRGLIGGISCDYETTDKGKAILRELAEH